MPFNPCISRAVYYNGAEDNPSAIPASFFENNLCPDIPASQQYAWISGTYIFFSVLSESGDGQSITTPNLRLDYLIDEFGDYLEDELEVLLSALDVLN